MKLDIFRTLWGVQSDWPTCVSQLRDAGCVGVEARVPLTMADQFRLRQQLDDEGLDYIAILFSGGDVIPVQAEGPEQHLARLAQRLDDAAGMKPRFVNLLPGNDRWSMAQQVEFFGSVQQMADERGLVCSFETHRATSLYSPWVTLELIRQLPGIRFTTDISHWLVVCERLLDDPADDLSPFIERVHHIQARVGYAQGPQVPHPAAPEYARELAFHQRFWEVVWRNQQQRGYAVTTLTPEFGPDGYLHHLPFTNVPVADLWSLNHWMARTERQHFDRFMQGQGPLSGDDHVE